MTSTFKDDVCDCGFNFENDCTNEDCGYYMLTCPFKTLGECPVQNEEL